jgi:alpha-L-fucosidase
MPTRKMNLLFNATPFYKSVSLNKNFKNPLLIFLLLLFFFAADGQQTAAIITTPKAVIDEFMDQRFGLFIHFGPVSLRGTEIGWSRNKEVPQEEYDNLYKEFNPALFNADEWVKIAKNAGMKYLTITAKHHDGFCLWPTSYSSYNIMNSPFKRDIVGELAKACKKQGIKFCIYFTVLDWHDADYPINNPHNPPKDSIKLVTGDMKRFTGRMKNELKELITRYKPYMLWFDGWWESPWKAEYGKDIYSFIKTVDKNVIVNNRLAIGDNKDFLTPEQKVGELNMNDPWESCITMGDQWAWKPNDKIKSFKECLQILVQTAAGNGNLLFNVGPMMDGRIEARQVARLKEMGDWLNKYGESIYATKGGPYMPNKIFAATRKSKKIYLHFFARETDQLAIPSPGDAKILKAYFLNGNVVKFSQEATGVKIELPVKLPDEVSNVIVLELDKNAEQIPIVGK